MVARGRSTIALTGSTLLGSFAGRRRRVRLTPVQPRARGVVHAKRRFRRAKTVFPRLSGRGEELLGGGREAVDFGLAERERERDEAAPRERVAALEHVQ